MIPAAGLRSMRSKYPGSCRECGGVIRRGEPIYWSKATGAAHEHCVVTGDRERDHANAEYRKGLAEGRRYSDEVKVYGRELADRFAMEDEYTRFWKYGEDY